MARASRQNRRPRVMPCCVQPGVLAVAGLVAVEPTDFFDVHFIGELRPFVGTGIRRYQVFKNFAEAAVLFVGTPAPHSVHILVDADFAGGDLLLFRVLPGCEDFVGINGELIQPGDYFGVATV